MVNSKVKNLLKSSGQIFIALFILFGVQGCEKSEVQDKKKQREILTSSILGFAYLEELNLEQAEAEFLHLIELDPEKSTGYASLGIVYLRMEKYDEAKIRLLEAKGIDPENAHIRILLSEAFDLLGDDSESIKELREALEFDPENAEVIYLLSESYSHSEKTTYSKEREQFLEKLTILLPANIVPKLDLVTLLLHNGNYDEALRYLEEIQQIYPEFPNEANQYFNQVVSFLNSETQELAVRQMQFFYNYIKITTPYQVGLKELTGQEGAMAGFPLISFDPSGINNAEDSDNILDVIKFNDVSEIVGLSESSGILNPAYVSFAVEDFDQDGNVDIYTTTYKSDRNEAKPGLFQSDLGNFTNIASSKGIVHEGNETSASFIDFDNDGHIDLYVVKENGNIMYQNNGTGSFEAVAQGKIPANNEPGTKAVFFDADHDGDLDIYLLKSGKNQFLRNNSDGTFSNIPDTFNDPIANSTDAVFSDFDGDGDIDLFVTNSNATNILYSNMRSGKFENATEKSGLLNDKGWNNVSAGDYNNDGFVDLLLAGNKKGEFALMTNNGEGVFDLDRQAAKTLSMLSGVKGNDSELFDFDNDGRLDILIAGSNPGGKGVFLFHNEGSGTFSNASQLLPTTIVSGNKIAIADYNNDGDLDIFITDLKGVHLLRNDGGNANHYLKIKLVGLRTGSGKNNHFGIGSKVEIRAGDLYEMKTATSSEIHFGIGKQVKAEVVRIIWTNGVPQNIYFPAGDKFLIEQQLLKGSCPFLYTWNGTEYEFVKDMMWRSALGMPLGIMGGTTKYAFSEPSKEYLKIPGEMLKPKKGVYSLQITKELWETIYFDKLELMAVDHPKGVEIFVDEKFTPPPFPEFKIYTTDKKHLPVSAVDEQGIDILSALSAKDDRYVSNMKPAKYQGLTSLHSIILDPGKNVQTDILVLNGWIFPTDASINFSISQSSDMEVVPPRLQVINEKGNWETVNESIGFPMGKNKTIVIDLIDKFLTGDHRVRLQTNMQIYWDYAFFTSDNPLPVKTRKLEMKSANLHFRGYSAMYRKGGRYGPHWFDYNAVSSGQKWRDLEGYYTRFGDVLPLLKEGDDQYIIANAGDEVTVEFDANLPDLPTGWTRDFIIYSEGWVKDGDMNTASGNTVLPLPFHGMSSYPYGPKEHYPVDSMHKAYNKKYNTRLITDDQFKKSVLEQESIGF